MTQIRQERQLLREERRERKRSNKELGRNGDSVRNNVIGGKSEYSNRMKNIDKMPIKYDNICKIQTITTTYHAIT